jgi:hypothetical protein
MTGSCIRFAISRAIRRARAARLLATSESHARALPVGLLALLLATTTACDREPSRAPRISDRPALTLTAPDSLPGAQFGRAVRLADGGVAAVEEASRRILRWDRTGRLTHLYGGVGAGPGRFRAPSLIQAVGADTLLLWDALLRRVTWLSLSSGETRDLLLRTSMASGASPIVGQMEDGTLLLRHERFAAGLERGGSMLAGALSGQMPRPPGELDASLTPEALPPPPADMPSVRALIVRIDAEGRQVGEVAKDVLVREVPRGGTPLYAPGLQMVTDGSRILMGFNASWQVQVLGPSGDSLDVFEREWTARPVSEAQRDAAREALQENRQATAAPVDISFAPNVPAFGRLLVAEDGTLWATTFTGPGVFTDSATVFSRRGRLLGTVAMPPRLRPTDVGSDYLLGLSEDGTGKAMVLLYDVQR